MQRVIILGSGGHGQVVADVLQRAYEANSSFVPIGYVDDDPQRVGQEFLGLSVLAFIADLPTIPHEAVVIGIGNNSTRRHFFNLLHNSGEQFFVARHPSAIIAPDVRIEPGTVICAGVIVNPGSIIGSNIILNTGCSVDHHSQIGSHTHIAPGVHLGGEVRIGEGCFIGIGATVMPQREVGDWSVVGAGALVHRHVPERAVVAGVPATELKKAGG